MMLQHALSYAARGWHVIPLEPSGKKPITKNGSKDATTSESQIQKWWAQWPTANIGLATGHCFFVVDIDGPLGAQWAEDNDLPQTLTARTSRGCHLYYSLPADFTVANSTGTLSEGVDVRGIGGYVVAPPSVHESGFVYHWEDEDYGFDISPASPYLLDLLRPRESSSHAEKFSLPAVIGEGRRDDTLYKFACSLRAKTLMVEPEIRAQLAIANERCNPPLSSKDLDRIAASACKHPPGPSTGRKQDVSPFGGADDDSELDHDDGSAKEKLAPNDIGTQILRDYRIMYCDGVLWEYRSTHWRQISSDRIKALAREYDGDTHTTARRRAEVVDFIKSAAMVEDQKWRLLEPYEIPVGNGVVDVRSMTLRDHRPDDYLQTCISVPFDPHAQAPELMRCLDTYFGADDDSDAKMDSLQEFFGYTLMPHARYKKALLCVGESDSGKSTIPFLMRTLMGIENVVSVGVEEMDDARKRAPLLGKLVNLLTELTSDAMIADGGFKTLVSTEEPIQFDAKFMPPVMDVPVCKHVIVTNTLPAINDRSRGTFNRLLLIRFNHVIPKDAQDATISDRLRGEVGGILLWALYGAQRLFHTGGKFTSVGVHEVEEYRASQNPVVEWISEACEVDSDCRALLSDMRERFSRWSGRPASPSWFAQCLQSAGYQTTKNAVYVGGRKGRACLGLRLA